ncbi:MAG: hypothetical protein WC372_06680 [Candidatus Neomarinimicrobiota bacterium]|nr:hypothetical protein [Candidatus Neomarinimicrobiota bacterium]
MKIPIIIVAGVFLLSGCSELIPLPTNNGNSGGINTDPNKFSQITPNWTFEELLLNDPVDIFASRDGRLYLAEPEANRIRVIRPSGEIEAAFYDTLSNLNINGLPVNPTSVCMDERMNVYFANDGKVVYFWPQFTASIGIAGIVTQREYRIDGKDTLLNPLSGLALGLTAKENSDIVDSTQTAVIDSLMRPRVFYDPASEMNRNGLYNSETGELIHKGNPIYASQNKSFVSLAPASPNDLSIYAADAINNYMLKITLIPSVLVRLANGQNVWQYTGILEDFIATPGTGAGTVSEPVSLCSDRTGNVYYTQTGEYFAVHKLRAGSYASEFLVGIDDIMELNAFGYARDIAVSSEGNIFVLDTLDRDVKMYDPDGAFVKSVAVREEWIRLSDSVYVSDSLVVRDTLILQQYPDLMNNPMALCYYQDVLYILDNGKRRMLRFTRVDDVIIGDPDREE